MTQSDNIFRHVWNLGYRSILPILPPNAVLSQRSNLARAKDVDKLLGKVPGEKRGDEWFGMPDWQAHETTETELDAWHASGAGLALRMDDGLVALDIDVSDVETSEDIERDALAMLGPSPCRIGRYPRRMLLYRITERVSYQRLAFTGPTDATEAIEVSCGKRQMVCFGIHQKTGKPYTWPRPLPAFRELTEITPQQLGSFVAQQRAKRPASVVVTEKERSERVVDPRTLPGDPDLIGAAMREMPNGRALYPTRDDYIRMGAALKAALPNDPALAYDLWTQWAARDDDGGTPEVWEKDWRGIKPPYAVGAHFVLDEADRHGNFGKEQWMLEDQDEVDRKRLENPFAAASAAEQRANAVDNPDAQPPIKWLRPSEWQGVEPPQREWEVEGWIPRREVTLLYGDGGIGKTLAIHQYAAAAAAGVKWLGQETRQARVMCFFCEDSEDELLRRQIDINKALGVTFADIDDRLRIASRKYLDNLFVLWDRHTGAMKRQAVWQQLLDDARAFKAEVIIIDTIADVFGGSEIDRGQVNAFVKACLGRLGNEIGASVIALGHPSVSGKQSGSGTSGSTAWNNAVRSRLYLRYPKGIEKGNVRELEGMKLNYGPKGALLKLRWEAGAFVLMASSKPAARSGEAGERTGLPEGSIEAAARDAVTAAILRSRGVQMNLSPKSPYYAARVLMRREAELLEAITFEEVEEALRRLDREGAVTAEKVGSDGSRRAVYGLLYRDNMSEDTGVFS